MGVACDAFLLVALWIKWVEHIHLGRRMADGDFMFPAVSTNGVLQPGVPLAHNAVQKWITEAVQGAEIRGTFSTHCFRRGGAQYRCMFAPAGQLWTLDLIRWWGGWAEGEHVSSNIGPHVLTFLSGYYTGKIDHRMLTLLSTLQRDTLMRYLLDELHYYEHDHSGALGPTARHANSSLVGDGPLTRALTADIAALHKAVEKISASQAVVSEDVRKVSAVQAAMSNDVKDMRQQFGNVSNMLAERSFAPTTTVVGPSGLPQSSLAAPQVSNNFNVFGEYNVLAFVALIDSLSPHQSINHHLRVPPSSRIQRAGNMTPRLPDHS